MKRHCVWITAVIVLSFISLLGCDEKMVGAPCRAETDEGVFDPKLDGVTYSIETRSVQCETRVCLTQTEASSGGSDQAKYSFCSCRCRDLEGHSLKDNPDKYGDLCECPPNTLCVRVLGDIEEAPEKVTGSYCIPRCMADRCDNNQVCIPSDDSEKPWEWKCGDRKNFPDDRDIVLFDDAE